MCLYPKLILNPKYRSTKKNGGLIPYMKDPRVKFVPIGCQECIECKKQKAREWQARLLEHIKTNTNGKFITLTFSNESIKKITEKIHLEADKNTVQRPTGYELDNAIATYATRHFLERYRKKYKRSIQHWLVTELGHRGTHNIHIHGIIWTNVEMKTIEEIWKYGFMWKGQTKNGKIINYVNARTIGYITKYVNKQDYDHKTYRSKILCSPGIGNNYPRTYNATRNKFNDNNTYDCYTTTTGHQIGLPIYWRNKIYTEEQREQLWLNKLDKQERWVLGEKISIAKTDKIYWNKLNHARETNKQLGYGNGEKNWQKEEYERQQRILKQLIRIKNAA